MENDFNNAFYGVYRSSKEIFKSKQRHLYINILDLLRRTSKATGLAEDIIGTERLVQFWLEDVFSLVFDDDLIQQSAINAMQQFLQLMDSSKIHQSECWFEIKKILLNEIPQKIHNLRETKNKCWQKIWSIAIQILDKEILKGASIINSYLSVVELGFRSSDSGVRAEAFACWRLLIKIFSDYNELLTPKRLKLICIPLKSTQFKSAYSTETKIRVWWYLITVINSELGNHFDTVVEPFLSYMFGLQNNVSLGAVHQHTSIHTIAILCLTQLFLDKREEYVSRFSTENNLELFDYSQPLMTPDNLNKHWLPIVKAALTAIQLLSVSEKNEHFETNQILLNLLLLQLGRTFMHVPHCTNIVCEKLIELLPITIHPLKAILNFVATYGIVMKFTPETTSDLSDSMESFIQLIKAGKPLISSTVILQCIEKIIEAVQQFHGNEFKWKTIFALAKVICGDNDNFNELKNSLLFWRCLVQSIIDYFPDIDFYYCQKEYSNILNNCIMWPLRQLDSLSCFIRTSFLDNDFCSLWHQFLLLGQSDPERVQFLLKIKLQLQNLCTTNCNELPLAEFMDAWVTAMLKLPCEENLEIEGIFLLLKQFIGLPQMSTTKSFEQVLNTFRIVLFHINDQELTAVFGLIKDTISEVVHISLTENRFKSKSFNQWKCKVLERFRMHNQKNVLLQIKEIFNNSDVFVIIPKVWVLNPEKLTDRQKERFEERSIIPALYNDMSQSQDSILKTWTPQKIVMAKTNEVEVTVGFDKQNDSHIPKIVEKLEENYIFEKEKNSNTNVENDNSNVRFVENSIRLRKSMRCKKLMESELEETEMFSKDLNTVLNKNLPDSVDNHLPIMDIQSKDMSQLHLYTNKSLSTVDITIEKNAVEVQSVSLENLVHQTESEKSQTVQIIKTHQEQSPKKTRNTISSLSSPPDRKFTNNISSPSLRPKTTTHLTRGAQLINMIRSKIKVDSPTSTLSPSSSTKLVNNASKSEKQEIFENIPDVVCTEQNAIVNRNLLTFSKQLPSPTASPSASILKRQWNQNSSDDTLEFPSSKRKRVSFHDPPVSLTKEFVKDYNESHAKLKRCLVLDKNVSTKKLDRLALKRRNKLESMVEIDNYTSDEVESDNHDITSEIQVSNHILEFNVGCQNQNESEPYLEKNLTFPNSQTALNIVINECSFEEVLEKYLHAGKLSSVKSADTFAKFVSKVMSSNTKSKSTILEVLSENYSKDFLECAVHENLSSVVCDQLNPSSVVKYICAKSKLNLTCRKSLLLEIPELLKLNEAEGEPLAFLKRLIESLNLTDVNILDLISIIIRIRSERQLISSESTDVSSSNL